MRSERSAGILLHITSLPGRFGIGDLGPGAFAFIDFLRSSGCQYWQFLPLGPTGYGNSPYQSLSAFAGNPLLISPESLYKSGHIRKSDLPSNRNFGKSRVNFPMIIDFKQRLLATAFQRFLQDQNKQHNQFQYFSDENEYWLNDYAFFMAFKDHAGGISWMDWPEAVRNREPNKLLSLGKNLKESILKHKFVQNLFFEQWQSLKTYAQGQGIKFIGDLPLYVALDSVDVWSKPDLFNLDKDKKPLFVAGVPPDYFSMTGQLWGNPIYAWEFHKASGYSWWLERFKSLLNLVDLIRLDHFRGLAAYWKIPAGDVTAEHGEWAPGPGEDFLSAAEAGLSLRGNLPVIAEDLGMISEDVIELRDRFNLPGMKILQFAFSSEEEQDFPHLQMENAVVYTGTHDNDTTAGWFCSSNEIEKKIIKKYLHIKSERWISWDLIRAAWSSPAKLAIAPMQDLLSLDTDARMNWPGRPDGNWEWRLRIRDMDPFIAFRMKRLNRKSHRS